MEESLLPGESYPRTPLQTLGERRLKPLLVFAAGLPCLGGLWRFLSISASSRSWRVTAAVSLGPTASSERSEGGSGPRMNWTSTLTSPGKERTPVPAIPRLLELLGNHPGMEQRRL